MESCSIGIRVAEKEQQQKKKRGNIYIYKKTPSIHSPCRSLFSHFFFFPSPCHPQLLRDTHLSSALRYARTQHVKEKRLSFSSLFFFIPYTRARVHTHIRPIKILYLMVNLKEKKKSEPLDNSMTSIHATRHTNHILKKGYNAAIIDGKIIYMRRCMQHEYVSFFVS